MSRWPASSALPASARIGPAPRSSAVPEEATSSFTWGSLSFRLDSATGLVRALQFRGHEIVRGIYGVIRDRDWGTLRTEVRDITRHETADALVLRVHAQVKSGEVDVSWDAEITAHAHGELTYRWRAQVRRDLFTQRTGLCVLHPAELAGAPCTIEHTNGRLIAGWFPTSITPHQPFQEVRAIRHPIAEAAAEVEVRVAGEVFETEDQRNWSDASFKTYCRPLDWPRPYVLPAGTVVEHIVRVAVHGDVAPAARSVVASTVATRGRPLRLPALGCTLQGPLPAPRRSRLQALRLNHVRVETSAAQLCSTLAWAGREAAQLGCALHLAILGATTAAPRCSDFGAVTRADLFDASGNTVRADVLAAWAAAGWDAPGTGTVHNFTELNRQRPAVDAPFARAVFGINAQVHAFDDVSLIETLSQHGELARHAHRIGAGRPITVAPIHLGPTADAADPRLHQALGAHWLLGSLMRLARTGHVESATYFHVGCSGGFLAGDGMSPAEQLLRWLADAVDVEELPVASARTAAAVDAIRLTLTDGRRQLLLRHDHFAPLSVDLPLPGQTGPFGGALAPFAGGRLDLPPFAVWLLELPR